MRRLVLLGGCLWAAALAVAASEDAALRFPDADAVLLDSSERVVYFPDGTSSNTVETLTLVLTERGRREQSVLELGYNRRYQRAGFTYVGIADSTGAEREVDVSATTSESTDNSSMAANIVDPEDRRIVVTVPALKVGDRLRVRYFLHNHRSRFRNQWSDLALMEWTHPIVRSVYEVVAPAELPIKAAAIRHPLGNVSERHEPLPDGSVRHVYTVTNSPQAFAENDMPPMWTQVQNVRLSTAADWPEISRWYWQLCEEHLNATNAAMAAMARQLGTVEDIFRFVSQEIRYMGLTFEDEAPGYAPHDVSVTFDNRYGVCRDKAGLLVAMLRLAGHEAYPVLINVGAKLDEEVPQPFFNHAIVAVALPGGGYRLMDPTNENTRDLLPAYLGNRSYLVARPEGERLLVSPVTPSGENALRVHTRGRLLPDDSVTFESSIDFTGLNDTVYRSMLARQGADERPLKLEQLLKEHCPTLELVGCEVSPEDVRDTALPLKLKLVARVRGAVVRGETTARLKVPSVGTAFSLVGRLLEGDTALERRKYPLLLDSTVQVLERTELELGGAFGEALAWPQFELGSGPLTAQCACSQSNGCLVVKCRTALEQVELSSADYLRLKANLLALEREQRRDCVFALDPTLRANVELLLDDTVVNVASPREWVVTNTLVARILSYRGKRRSAELKFPYQPGCEALELVSGVVSNRDGRVAVVSPREVNDLDAEYVAKAPRYPAGRLKVVNLPAVEVGSVVALTAVRAVTNAAAPFHQEFTFDSAEPLGRRRVTVNGETREALSPRPLPVETAQPAEHRWRDVWTVALDSFADVRAQLEAAAEVAALDPAEFDFLPSPATPEALRRWLVREVRLVGLPLYELPLASQLTEPRKVLADRYATRLDFIRTLVALLKGAGYAADVVWAAEDAAWEAADRERIRPGGAAESVREFSLPLCRVRTRRGGFLGLGGETETVFLGTENEYAPYGVSAQEGCSYYDAAAGEFGQVKVLPKFVTGRRDFAKIDLAADGTALIDVLTEWTGREVATFRRLNAEMLPEARRRYFQAILEAVAQSARSTSELKTDVTGYPARREFSCRVSDYAVAEGDTLQLEVPVAPPPLPELNALVRRSPLKVEAADAAVDETEVWFPVGYDVPEYLPPPLAFGNPLRPEERWYLSSARVERRGGRSVVIVRREIFAHPEAVLPPECAQLLLEWSRQVAAPAAVKVVMRKPVEAGGR